MRFETISCPACGHSAFRPEREVRDRFNVIPDRAYTIVRCDSCRLLFLNPRPDAESIGEFYQAKGYDPFISAQQNKSALTVLYTAVRRFTMRRKAARVAEGLPTSSKSLDVGCATGEMLVELRRRGHDVFGVEPDPHAADFARGELGLTVWAGTIEDVPPGSGPYDLIVLWHVLEHVHDLSGNLKRLRELLSEGGRLAIAVPNPESADARAYGNGWVAWDTPRHLYHFEPAVLLDLLGKSGFRAEHRGAVAFDAFYHCLLSEKSGMGRYLRAGVRGLGSFLRGTMGGSGSSELYFAYKR